MLDTNSTAHSMGNGASAPNLQGFLAQCGESRLLAVALGAGGKVLGATPELQDVLGAGLDEARVAELLSGDGDALHPAAVLPLEGGARIVTFSEDGETRIQRLLQRFGEAHHLTGPERAALVDLAAGLSAKESAQRLQVSPETVRARRKRIFRRVGVGSCGGVLAKLLRG